MNLYQNIEDEIRKVIGDDQKIEFDSKFADIAIPCFEHDDPTEKAKELSEKLSNIDYFSDVSSKGPFVNINIDWIGLSEKIISSITEDYGSGFASGEGIVEHTSVNPNASPHVGRARNSIIGDSLVRLLRFSGMNIETHYYVNDMGKQIALLVWAAQGNDVDFDELLELYVKANEKMKDNKEIEEEVFNLLRKFKDGDEETVNKFREVVGVAMEGQREIFSKINIEFDKFDFESDILKSAEFKEIMSKLEESEKLFEDEEGRLVLDTTEVQDDTYLVIRRSNGTYLYGGRDLGYTLWKHKQGKDLNLIILGEDQKLYQKQIEYAMELAGYEPPESVHYSFVNLPEGKMSTRKGNVILLEDLIKEVYDRSIKEIETRYNDLDEEEKKQRAGKIAVAAIRYGIIRVSPEKNVIFDPDKEIKFEGNTGPYIQYTYARAKSIIEKSEKEPNVGELGEDESELIKTISRFPVIVQKSFDNRRPHLIADYVYDLANRFNKYYEKTRIIGEDKEEARLNLVESVSVIIDNCLNMIGIETMEEM